jgi:Leucine-rich repeat (LRR) protein
LNKLSIENNQLTTLSSGISALKELSTFTIGNNPLESIPIKEIMMIPSLTDIGLTSRKTIEKRREEERVKRSKDANQNPELKNGK